MIHHFPLRSTDFIILLHDFTDHSHFHIQHRDGHQNCEQGRRNVGTNPILLRVLGYRLLARDFYPSEELCSFEECGERIKADSTANSAGLQRN